MAPKEHYPGQRLSFAKILCTVRYVGPVAGTTGTWLGVEWDDPSRGKHNGTHKGHRYFTCQSRGATAASFVRPSRPSDRRRSLVAAIKAKYASEVDVATSKLNSGNRVVVISGKVAEEVGFDKIRRQLARLDELKIVILDGMCIAHAAPPDGLVAPEESGGAMLGGGGGWWEKGGDVEYEQPAVDADGEREREKSIRETCPLITELDLSQNVLERFGEVAKIAGELDDLRILRVNGNRFLDVLHEGSLENSEEAFRGIEELSLADNLMSWEELCHIAQRFPSLTSLAAGTNQLSFLNPVGLTLPSTLTSIDLEYNNFDSFSDLAVLAPLPLRTLSLKGNTIATISSPSALAEGHPPPIFNKSLSYLDISYNAISTWSVIDALHTSFPGLTSLRLSHNPIYDNPNPSTTSTSANASATSTVSEEAYMLTVGRLPNLTTLNFSAVSPQDRLNAEMFYLSRIARQLAAVPEGQAERDVTAQHPRWRELCETYGEPVVRRTKEVDGAFLEGRLVSVLFRLVRVNYKGYDRKEATHVQEVETREVQIPKSFDMYAVRGIVGRLFGAHPLFMKLVWETGEWDPVGGFDDEDDESSEDEEEADTSGTTGTTGTSRSENEGGRFVRREVELKESPRLFGFCVDGQEATIRVEVTW